MIFISYSSCDRVIAEALLNYLENRGIKCWIAFRDITSGNFSGEITRALRNSDIMVVVCSKESCKSEHVKNEVTLAFNQHKHIIPYLLEDNPFDDDLEYFLSLKQHIKTRGSQEKDFSLIEKFIRDYRGEPADVAPTPTQQTSFAPAAAAPVTAAPSAPVAQPANQNKKGGAGLIIGIVAGVLLLGGGGAFFLLKKPAQEPVAQNTVTETPATQQAVTEPAKEQVAAAQAQTNTQEQTKTQEQPKTTASTTAQTQTQPKTSTTTSSSTQTQQSSVARKPENDGTPKLKPNANTDTFSGSVINGYPNGFGTYTYKVRRRIDMHDPEERYAEAGDYIKGDWKDGHLNYGEWYGSDGVKKAFIRLGDNPDTAADQKLGKCVKK